MTNLNQFKWEINDSIYEKNNERKTTMIYSNKREAMNHIILTLDMHMQNMAGYRCQSSPNMGQWDVIVQLKKNCKIQLRN